MQVASFCLCRFSSVSNGVSLLSRPSANGVPSVAVVVFTSSLRMLFRRQVVEGGAQTPRRLGMSLASGRKEARLFL